MLSKTHKFKSAEWEEPAAHAFDKFTGPQAEKSGEGENFEHLQTLASMVSGR
jgi:hypothetical protein